MSWFFLQIGTHLAMEVCGLFLFKVLPNVPNVWFYYFYYFRERESGNMSQDGGWGWGCGLGKGGP